MTEPDPETSFDFGALLQQAQEVQRQLEEAQAAAAEQVVEGQAGGGAVRVEVTGGLRFQAVAIDPAAVDPDDVAMLQDLVLAACNDAMARVQELNSQALGALDPGALGLSGSSGPPELDA